MRGGAHSGLAGWGSHIIVIGALLLAGAGCAPAVPSAAAGNPPAAAPTRTIRAPADLTEGSASETPAAFATVTPILTPFTLPTAGATTTAEPTEAAPATPGTPCPDQACAAAAEHFWLERPIPADAQQYVDGTYPYGSTQQDLREPHHGVEFSNKTGTPVIAAAAGTVVVAGDDSGTAYGPATHFYGSLVVVQLEQTLAGQPVFTLYGHLSKITAEVGQSVHPGDPLGEVGQTGVAIGPHLHFEVRVGENTYTHTRNPELWLKPLAGYKDQPYGALAGRVVDLDGNFLYEQTLVVRPMEVNEKTRARYFTTYAHETLNGDDVLQENFSTTDLPAGKYSVAVNTTKFYEQSVIVKPGQLTWVTFTVKPPAADAAVAATAPPPATATPAPTQPPTGPPPTPNGPTATAVPASDSPAGTLRLIRPVSAAAQAFIDRTCGYGCVPAGSTRPNHGVNWLGPAGTPVLAGAAGTVIVAGADDQTAYGPAPDFYGQLVILHLTQSAAGQPVFVLYGHLSKVNVAVGQSVPAGAVVGEIGQTGSAQGPHLELEVRVGANSYAHTRNPELWLQPSTDVKGRPFGRLAGRVVDPAGRWLPDLPLVIRPVNVNQLTHARYSSTYAAALLAEAPDQTENFGAGDLPAGQYSVSVTADKYYEQKVEVQAGQLTWFTFTVKARP